MTTKPDRTFRQFAGDNGKKVYVDPLQVAGIVEVTDYSTEIHLTGGGGALRVSEPIDKVKNDLG